MTALAQGAALAPSTAGSPLWYATRATGVVALVLLTLTVVLGIAGAGRLAAPGAPRIITAGLHRNLSVLVVALVTVHVLTTVADGYVPISLASAFIPFSAPYRPLWLGLGALALDLLLAVFVTSALRDRIPRRAWRAVHWLAYACWPCALWHGLGTGSDTRSAWLLTLDTACLAAVTAAAGWRLWQAREQARAGPWSPGRWLPERWFKVAAGALAVLPLATVVFAAVGPLQAGWSHRSGTSVILLRGHAAGRQP